jgi:hypothetical protein
LLIFDFIVLSDPTANYVQQFPKEYYTLNMGTRMRDRPRNRWLDEVGENGRIVGGEGWQEKVHNREKWQKLLRTPRNHPILHTPMNE